MSDELVKQQLDEQPVPEQESTDSSEAPSEVTEKLLASDGVPPTKEELQEHIAFRFEELKQELLLIRGEGPWLDSFNLAAAAAQSNL